MNKNTILDYVMNTPRNTNRAVLNNMLDSLVESSDKESIPDSPTFNDGKTRLFVTVASIDRPVIAIYFGCTVVGGVTIDWGDGSDTEVTTSTERTRYSHSYSAAGDYIIALEITEGELVLEGASGIGIMTKNYNNPEPPYSFPYVIAALKRVEIGDGIPSIGDYAFCNCSALTSVIIPSSVTSIGQGAFSNCSTLRSIVIPEGVTSIDNGAFNNCSALTSVIIPSSVTSIGQGAFMNCSTLTSVVIPEGVTSIGSGAFGSCYALTSVTITSSVTNINGGAFGALSSIGGIHILSSTPPTVVSGSFSGVPTDCKIYIPTGSMEAYSTATNWSSYVSMLVEE